MFPASEWSCMDNSWWYLPSQMALLIRKDLGSHLTILPLETFVITSYLKGAATSPAYQGGTAGSRGERNGHPSHPSCLYDDATVKVDQMMKGQDFKLRQINRVGTWNVRTLLTTGSLQFLLREMDRCKVHFLGIFETQWCGRGILQLTMTSQSTTLEKRKVGLMELLLWPPVI